MKRSRGTTVIYGARGLTKHLRNTLTGRILMEDPTPMEWFYGILISVIPMAALVIERYKDHLTFWQFAAWSAVVLVWSLGVICTGRLVAYVWRPDRPPKGWK